MGGDAAKRRAHRNHRRDVIRHLRGECARHHSAEAVSHQVHPLAGLPAGLLDRLGETMPDQQIGTLGIEPDLGIIRLVANPFQPRAKLAQVQVGAHEAGNHHDGRPVSGRYSEAPEYRGNLQADHLESDQEFLPDGR